MTMITTSAQPPTAAVDQDTGTCAYTFGSASRKQPAQVAVTPSAVAGPSLRYRASTLTGATPRRYHEHGGTREQARDGARLHRADRVPEVNSGDLLDDPIKCTFIPPRQSRELSEQCTPLEIPTQAQRGGQY